MYNYTIVGNLYYNNELQDTKCFMFSLSESRIDDELVYLFKSESWRKWSLYHNGDIKQFKVRLTAISLLRAVDISS